MYGNRIASERRSITGMTALFDISEGTYIVEREDGFSVLRNNVASGVYSNIEISMPHNEAGPAWWSRDGTCVRFCIDGKTLSIDEWASEVDIPDDMLIELKMTCEPCEHAVDERFDVGMYYCPYVPITKITNDDVISVVDND